MGEPVYDTDSPFAEDNSSAAAVICRTEDGIVHAGLLYKRKEQVNCLHLGNDNDLKDRWRWGRIWASPNVDPEKLFAVAAWCHRILHTYNKTHGQPGALRFPYGIKFSQSQFVTTRGGDIGLMLGPGSDGLTCATFILAVFNAVGLKLINEASWPSRKDADRAWVMSTFSDSEQKKRLLAEIESGAIRIRPDEVMAACNGAPPAEFQDCQPTCQRILAMLPIPSESR